MQAAAVSVSATSRRCRDAMHRAKLPEANLSAESVSETLRTHVSTRHVRQ